MVKLHFMAWRFALALISIATAGAFGQDPSTELRTGYPTKVIRIVTSEPGGTSDLLGRLIAPHVSNGLGQQVIMENRAGVIAIETVAKAPPDGYTLLFYGSVIWLTPFLRDNVQWEVKDFAPVTLAARSPNMLVVHPSLPVNSVKELIALAKAKPGELNYGSSAAGASSHLAGELFNALAGVKIVRIPFKGNGPALTSVMAGQVQMMFPSAGEVSTYIKAGKLKALAVTSAQPSALAPGLPTIAATLPGYETTAVQGVLAPAGTPAPVINRLNQEFVRAFNRPEVKDRLFSLGSEVIASSPEQFAAAIKSDMTRMGKVIKDVGIRAE